MNASQIDITTVSLEGLSEEAAIFLERNLGILRSLLEKGEGVTDTFTTADSKTVTVVDGIITGIV